MRGSIFFLLPFFRLFSCLSGRSSRSFVVVGVAKGAIARITGDRFYQSRNDLRFKKYQ